MSKTLAELKKSAEKLELWNNDYTDILSANTLSIDDLDLILESFDAYNANTISTIEKFNKLLNDIEILALESIEES